jgi:hypothetical protein
VREFRELRQLINVPQVDQALIAGLDFLKKKSKMQKAHPQPYSRAGRVEVEWLRKTPVVFTPTRLGVESRTFSIYDVGVPGESRRLLSIPLDYTRVWPLRGGGWKRWQHRDLYPPVPEWGMSEEQCSPSRVSDRAVKLALVTCKRHTPLTMDKHFEFPHPEGDFNWSRE